MRYPVLFLLLGLLLLVAPSPFRSAEPRAALADEPSDTGLMAVKQPKNLRHYTLSAIPIGPVIAVDAGSITVKDRRDAADVPPQKFTVCDTLAAGEVVAQHQRSDAYRLADVRVGDLVYLCCGRSSGGPVLAQEVTILRRPGGRLGPPALGPFLTIKGPWPRMDFSGKIVGYHTTDRKVDLRIDPAWCGTPRLHHEWINAIQDFEERGIKLPPDMRPKEPRREPGGCYLLPDGTVTKWGEEPPQKNWLESKSTPSRPTIPPAKP